MEKTDKNKNNTFVNEIPIKFKYTEFSKFIRKYLFNSFVYVCRIQKYLQNYLIYEITFVNS